MSAIQNKQILKAVFDELAVGNGKPFVDTLADDFTWIMTGTTKWSGTYRGKKAVQEQVLGPLFASFATQYTNTAQRFIAEDDMVVVECRGQVQTKTGHAYNNTYCYVCRMAHGKLVELVEYFDTALVDAALGDPQALRKSA